MLRNVTTDESSLEQNTTRELSNTFDLASDMRLRRTFGPAGVPAHKKDRATSSEQQYNNHEA